MGKQMEPAAGAIYRYYKGECRKLVAGVSVSNAICFSPEGDFAYFADTKTRQIMRWSLGAEGWPKGDPALWIDMQPDALRPDGAVVDAEGLLWNAQWGAGRVACYDQQGLLVDVVSVPTPQSSCPAFGGHDLKSLYVTTAADGMTDAGAGMTYCCDLDVVGQTEHKVLL
jgi:sugar lactone lactonase YvrE